MFRTNYCGQLNEKNVGEEPYLDGLIEDEIMSVIFIDLRDREGIAQVVLTLTRVVFPCEPFVQII